MTDHNPLEEVLSKKGLDVVSMRTSRWIVGLWEYCFGIRYVLGSCRSVADYLSRFRLLVEEEEGGKGV